MTLMTDLAGESPEIGALRDEVRRLLGSLGTARLPPVLIQGETGTGKGLLARLLHKSGPRAAGAFIAVNCAAIPETLLESEMFGYERGAFTDARQPKPGLLEAAQHGTFFLDEVGLLPEGVQGKLLKAIEDREVRRLGATRSVPLDVWIIAATSEDLAAARQTGRFQEALYHRLSVLTFRLPSLRARGDDVLLLAERFLGRACAEYGLGAKRLSTDARRVLREYAWPGNVRELENVMERVALLGEEAIVGAERLGLAFPPGGRSLAAPAPDAPAPAPPEGDDVTELRAALERTGWNVSLAARRLGISRNAIRYRMEKHGLRPGQVPPAPPRPAAERSREVPAEVGPFGLPSVDPPRGATPMPAPSPAETRGAQPVRWEQRRVTLLRAALVMGPTPTPVPDRYAGLDLVLGKIATFGGRLEELGATGIVAAFGLDPVEDAPRRAAHAAMAILRATQRARTEGEAVDVRLAIHVGEVVVVQTSGSTEMALESKQESWALLGALVARAEPNSVVVSEAAVPFLEPRFDLIPGEAGPALPGRTYRLVGLEPSALEPRRRLARFVGRGRELELVQSQFATAGRGYGQVVGIVGEAGIGKTRLVTEFRQVLGSDGVCFEAHCLSYGTAIPYLPLLDIVRSACGLLDNDPPETLARKVHERLIGLGMETGEGVPYLLHLLGVKTEADRLEALSPEAVQARTFETLRQLTLRASRRQPLALVVENLHWIDRASEEYLTSLVEAVPGAPVLLLFTYRPGYRPPWSDKSYATQIALQPLAPRDSLALVRSVVPVETVPDALAETILARAEGNPFFLEELVLVVAERSPGATAPAVPATVQDVLLARISRLSAEAKWALQTAAVLGREVPLDLLRAIWTGPGPLEPQLRELTRLEFLHGHGGLEEPVYFFKHALTREVAYESLLPSRRRELHAAAGEALERLYAGRLEEIADRLAHHYTRAERAPKAVAYLVRVAERAAGTYAHVEAAAVLREALRQAERLPDEEREGQLTALTLRLAHSLYFLGQFPEALELLLRRREQAARLTDPGQAAAWHFWLGYMRSHLGDHVGADENARQAIAEAERAGDTVTLGQAHYLLARGGFWSGRFVEGVAHGRRAVAFLQRTEARWWLGAAHWGVAFNHGFIGEFARGLAAAREAQKVGEAIADPRLLAYAAWTVGWLEAARGYGEIGVAACRQSLEHSPDPVNTTDALSFLGGAYLELGDFRQAIPPLEDAVERWTRFQHRPMLGWFTAVLGEACLAAGNVGRARELAEQGREIAASVGFKYAVGWACRVLGRLARLHGTADQGDVELRAGLAAFLEIGARFEAARTLLDLAAGALARRDAPGGVRLAREAHALLAGLGAPVYEERARQLATAPPPDPDL
jgi:transcriptional regulator with AAA-type ATPase domain/tetratricopeptide (TPR) repeat protein